MESFEWREDKEEINKKKHGISLEAGMLVFKDDYRLELYDEANSTVNEDRYITIGRSETTRILYVVYTMRNHGATTRLISVRRTEPHEERLYKQSMRR